MSNAHLKLVTPSIVKRTVTPSRLPNGDLRTREYLTEAEVERLMTAARKNRWGRRDATMTLAQRCFTSAGSRRALQTLIQSLATSCGRCGGSSVNSRSPSAVYNSIILKR
jgi:hypothetical protein